MRSTTESIGSLFSNFFFLPSPALTQIFLPCASAHSSSTIIYTSSLSPCTLFDWCLNFFSPLPTTVYQWTLDVRRLFYPSPGWFSSQGGTGHVSQLQVNRALLWGTEHIKIQTVPSEVVLALLCNTYLAWTFLYIPQMSYIQQQRYDLCLRRCEISKNLCCRNLAVEKAVSELPTECTFCLKQFPRSSLERHQKEECQDRYSPCTHTKTLLPPAWKSGKISFRKLVFRKLPTTIKLNSCKHFDKQTECDGNKNMKMNPDDMRYLQYDYT